VYLHVLSARRLLFGCPLVLVSLLVAGSAQLVATVPASAVTTAAWEAVPFTRPEVTSGSFSGKADGLIIGYAPDDGYHFHVIAFWSNGVMTRTPYSGTIIGIVDIGLPSATAYFEVSEGSSNLDLNGDGDQADVQIRMAVGSPELVVVPGAQPNGFGTPIVSEHVITGVGYLDDLVQYRGRGQVTRFLFSSASPFIYGGIFLVQTLWSGDHGVGRYVLKQDGTLIDSGLRGQVIGAVQDIPIVLLFPPDGATGSPGTYLANSPPTWLGNGGYVMEAGSTAWVISTETTGHGDLNGDGRLSPSILCRVTPAGLSGCVPDVVATAYSVVAVGEDAVVFTGYNPTDNVESVYYVRGTEPAIRLGGSRDWYVWYHIPNGALLRIVNASGNRVSWLHASGAGVRTLIADQSSTDANATWNWNLGDGRFIMSIPKTGTGDPSTGSPFVAGPSGLFSIDTPVQFIPTGLSGATAMPLEPNGAFVFGVNESVVGQDLNGDGDQLDIVAHVWDDGQVINLRRANGSANDTFGAGFTVQNGLVTFGQNEAQAGDLNGDGDVLDVVRYAVRRTGSAAAFVLPARVLDTRENLGYVGAKPQSGQVLEVEIAGHDGVPTSGATAVALNITVTAATGAGFVTVWGSGDRPNTSNLNIERTDQTIANLVLAPIGSDGKIRIYTSGGGHIIADVAAWFGPTSIYRPTGPTRLADTRNKGTKPVSGSTTEIPITSPGKLAIVNVTATDTTKPGFLTVWGSGNRPTTSNVNFTRAGMTIPNLVIVPIGDDGKIRVYNDGGSHIIVDLFGTIAGDNVNPHPPERILDTRNTATPTAGATIEVAVKGTPGDAVIANVTATNVTAPGYVTVWPSGPPPNASNLNPEYAGQSIANLVLTRIGPDNKIRLYTDKGADLIVDTFATIAAL
jgi:hypothetical protein